uniref:Uncharacterized protein n=1 Tax=Heterorhabditis bacteriophora TaxID=37862 RepID=A0A1I7X2R6_HETBA
MGRYRWHLFNNQTFISSIVQPSMFLPLLAGNTNGIISTIFGVSAFKSFIGPSLCIFIPGFYVIFRAFLETLGMQSLNNIMVFVIAGHGLVSTLCLIYFNKPYRQFVFGTHSSKRVRLSFWTTIRFLYLIIYLFLQIHIFVQFIIQVNAKKVPKKSLSS